MKKPRGPGRPRLPKGEAKGVVLAMRFTAAERAEIDAAAERAGKTTAQWARETLLAHAAAAMRS